MVGKHGRLDITPNGPTRPTYTYVDSNLQLTGNFTGKLISYDKLMMD